MRPPDAPPPRPETRAAGADRQTAGGAGRRGQEYSRRIQQKRTAGWRKPEGAVSVARPGRWGNPHRVDELGRPEAVARYRDDLLAGRLPYSVDDVRRELGGRTLMCWCPIGQPCHGDVLAEVAS